MPVDQMLMLALLVGVLGLFIWGRWRYDLIAFSALLLAVVLGLVEPMAAFRGFGHPAVITVAAVLIISRALSGSALIALLSRHLDQHAERHASVQIGALGGITSILSAFINNVGALALFMPVALRAARRAEHAPGLVLMPLAFAAILGGLITLIGTPPNIIVAAYRAEVTGAPFAMFDFAPVGFPVALMGVLFVALIGWRLIRARGAKAARRGRSSISTTMSPRPGSPRTPRLSARVCASLNRSSRAERRAGGVDPRPSRIHTATWRGRIKQDDILVIEAAPEGIGETVGALGLELVGVGREVADALGSEDLALLEVVVSPNGMIEGRTASGVSLRSRYGVNLLAVSRQGKRVRSRLRTLRFRAATSCCSRDPRIRCRRFWRASAACARRPRHQDPRFRPGLDPRRHLRGGHGDRVGRPGRAADRARDRGDGHALPQGLLAARGL